MYPLVFSNSAKRAYLAYLASVLLVLCGLAEVLGHFMFLS